MEDYMSEFVFTEDYYENLLGEYSGEWIDDDAWYESSYETKITDHEESVIAPAVKSEAKPAFASYQSKLKEQEDREATAREQEKRDEFRKLMGMKLRRDLDGESIKTVLTSEELEENVEETDAESSSSSGRHPCLKTFNISDSQLRLTNFYNKYPVPVDSGLVPAYLTIYPPVPAYKEDGIQKFVDLIREKGLRPINSIKEMLRTDTLDLRYYGIDSRIVEVLSEAMVNNTSVQTIDLTDNWLSPDACCHLGNLLRSNGIISCLILAGCRIGSKGAKKLKNGIAEAPSLVDLDLSRCDIGDHGLEYITTAIYENPVIENVDLTDNNLHEGCAKHLSKMVAETNSLKRLNLSWNYLYGEQFAETFFEGLSKNSTLQYLNMATNSLDKDTAKFLSSYLANSPSLRGIDLKGNAFTATEAEKIAQALTSNTVLETLHLGNNSLEPSGVFALVNAVTPEKSPDLQMTLLDLENVWVDKNILRPMEIINRDRSWLEIRLGGILSNYKLHEPNAKKIFLRRANFEAMSAKKKKQRKDFGHFVLSLNDEVVSTVKFKDLVKDFKLKLTESLVDEIAKAFESPKGQIDLKALKEFYLNEYPETTPPPPTPQKDGKKSAKRKAKK